MPAPPSRPPSPIPELSEEQPVSRVVRFGSLVGVSLLAAFVASAPAALRLWGASETSGAWIALAALEVIPLMLAIAIFRRTRGGLRSLSGAHAPEHSLAAAVWLLAMVLLLSLIGAVLRATTHNRPLAGVTFAIAATVAGLALVPTSARIVEIALGWLHHGAKTRLLCAVVLAAACASLIALRLVHALPAEAELSAPASAIVVDLSAFALAAIIGSSAELAARRSLAVIGPPAAVVLLAFGCHRIVASSALSSIIVERGPIFTAAVHFISKR